MDPSLASICIYGDRRYNYFLHTCFSPRQISLPFHKLHHEYTHTVSPSAEYTSLPEFVFSNVAPSGAGFVILNSFFNIHMSTLVVWVVLRVFETTNVHSGYDFKWSPFGLLPLSASSQYHFFHHSHNFGNYSSFFVFWDTLMGYNQHYYQYKHQLQKQHKPRIKK